MKVAELFEWAKIYKINNILDICSNKNFEDNKEALFKLKSLDLSCKDISTIPKGLFALHRLEKLYLSHNNLEELPQEILKLKSLKILDISWNHITEDLSFLPLHVKVFNSWNRKKRLN